MITHRLGRIFLVVLVVAGLSGAVISSLFSYRFSLQAEELAQSINDAQDLGGQTWDSVKKIFTGKSEIEEKVLAREILHRRSWLTCYIFMLSSLLAMGIGRWGLGESRTFLLLGLGVAANAAVFGIITPAMTMTAQQFTPVGEISLYHESRGIWDTVRGLLGRDGSLIVGIPLLVFSIVLPLAKTALLATALVSRGKIQPRVMDLISRLGRWSMADVFVVALLLSFFAANHNRLISASLLPGMAFFAYYAALSILLGGRIEEHLGPDRGPEP